MSTILDRIPAEELELLLNAKHGQLESLCQSMSLNYNSVRAAMSRRKNNAPPQEIIDYPEIDEVAIGSFYFDHELRQYVTRIKSAPESIVKSEAEHNRLLRRYNSAFGKGASIDELVREFNMPAKWIQEYARAHKWQRNGLPFSPVELSTRDTDELADEAIIMQEVKLRHKIHEKQWENIKRDAAKWQTAELELWQYVDALPVDYRAPEMIITNRPHDNFAVLLSTADLHFGKYGDHHTTGSVYNKSIARTRLLVTLQSLLERVSRFGVPAKFIITIGGDDENIDNLQKSTTSGTPQDQDGSAIAAAIEYSSLIRDYLEMIRQLGVPMDIYLTAGNHNRLTSVYRSMELQAFYRDTENVTVNITPQPRTYVMVNDTLICLTHEGVKDIGMTMAVEASELWGKSKHRCVFQQHLHHEALIEKGGVKIFRLPSLSGADAWHAEKGYTTSAPGASAYIIGSGVEASLFAAA